MIPALEEPLVPKERYRSEFARWFWDLGFHYSVHLAFNRVITHRAAHDCVRALHGAVDRRLLGSRYHRLPIARRSSWVFVVEHPKSNYHLHGFWRLGRGNWFDQSLTHSENIHALFAAACNEGWRKITSSGSCVVNAVEHDAYRYAAKGLTCNHSAESLILSDHLTRLPERCGSAPS
jgi:hypothetical protein